MLMTNYEYRFLVDEQMREIGIQGHQIVIEPARRNTAPAICAAAEILAAQDPEALMLVAPSDHQIIDVMAFSKAVATAAERARVGDIVTFGVRPTYPETGYGYIELSQPARGHQPQPYRGFHEKPCTDRAEQMLDDGQFFWNAGIFMFSAKSILDALRRSEFNVCHAVAGSVAAAKPDISFLKLGQSYCAAPDISIDKAVLEKEAGWVVPMTTHWTDMGTWRTVWEDARQDSQGVAVAGSAKAMDCENTLLRSEIDAVQVVGIGLKNLAVVATRDAVLVADLSCAQEVGEAVDQLRAAGATQADEFPRQSRPWGYYETLAAGSRYQVKSIVVKPGGELSLQSHAHRAEHWIVVEGAAHVTIGREERQVAENQSIFIPQGEIHRLGNRGTRPLRLIEVQTGSYFGEDDIVRYQDIYDRV